MNNNKHVSWKLSKVKQQLRNISKTQVWFAQSNYFKECLQEIMSKVLKNKTNKQTKKYSGAKTKKGIKTNKLN